MAPGIPGLREAVDENDQRPLPGFGDTKLDPAGVDGAEVDARNWAGRRRRLGGAGGQQTSAGECGGGEQPARHRGEHRCLSLCTARLTWRHMRRSLAMALSLSIRSRPARLIEKSGLDRALLHAFQEIQNEGVGFLGLLLLDPVTGAWDQGDVA